MHPGEPHLHSAEIQGNVLPGFNTRAQRLIGLSVGDANTARAWLADRVKCVTTLADVDDHRVAWRRSGDREERPLKATWLNLCFSYRGLERIGGAGFDIEAIRDPWFKLGARRVAGSLGDRDAERWPEPDVLAILADNDPRRLEGECHTFLSEAEAHGLQTICDERGARLKDAREHFGFRDGISVPAVRGTVGDDDDRPLTPRRRSGAPRADRYGSAGALLVWPGQAVFGYPGQSRVSAVEPGETVRGGGDWMDDGSFLVFRKLRQDVAAFDSFAADAVAKLGAEGKVVTAERVKAMLIGRWPNGNPLTRHPEQEGTADSDDNDFRYFADTPPDDYVDREGKAFHVRESPADPEGDRCPHLAHIRKVNPRDAPTDLAGEPMTLALQPFRRGIPYREPDDADRGLLFLAYTTAIDERFGALTRGWVNQARAPEALSASPDAIAGNVSRLELRVDDVSATVDVPRPFVTAVGGGFFFAPSKRTLAALAGGR